MKTPKNLTDLRYAGAHDYVIILTDGQNVSTEANRYFHELFAADMPVKVNLLFSEDGKRVYEAYQDSGSSEYLYLIS